MTDQLWEAVASGGSIAVVFAFAIGFLWRWFTKREKEREAYWVEEVTRVRSTGERIIAQKDAIIEKKDEKLLEQAKDYDTRIGSIVKTYDAKIKEKDDLLNSIREDMQSVLVQDAELRTRQIDSINHLTEALKNR